MTPPKLNKPRLAAHSPSRLASKLPTSKLSGLALAAGLAASLSACGPLVKLGDDSPPPSLFALRSAEPEGAETAPRALPSPLLLTPPDTIAELRPPRIAVFTSLTGVSYLPASRWVDPPARLMARLLEDRLREASSGLVITPRQFEVGYNYRLNTRLTKFHVDARNGDHIARVRIEAALLTAPSAKLPDQLVVGTRSFEAERPLASTNPKHVTENLNAAANDVATQLANWLATLGPAPQGLTPAPASETTPPVTTPEGGK